MGWSAGPSSNDPATIRSEIAGMMLWMASTARSTVAVITAAPGQLCTLGGPPPQCGSEDAADIDPGVSGSMPTSQSGASDDPCTLSLCRGIGRHCGDSKAGSRMQEVKQPSRPRQWLLLRSCSSILTSAKCIYTHMRTRKRQKINTTQLLGTAKGDANKGFPVSLKVWEILRTIVWSIREGEICPAFYCSLCK